MEWEPIQQEIQACRRCEEKAVRHLRVPASQKRRPPWEPLRPVRLYFVSVAPPWGGVYFWDETERDLVREGLFKALRNPLSNAVTNCRQFRDLSLFLTPAVKCPSEKNDNDHAPSRAATKNCASFLRSELVSAGAQRILALGRVPFGSLCDIFGLDAPKRVSEFRRKVWWVRLGEKQVPLTGTYFPGNNRHRGFVRIAEDIERLLSLTPRNGNT
jgi:uracil-DNA glycosylase